MKAYPFFSATELACHCGECDGGEMNQEFMDKLIKVRSLLGAPMVLSSAYRCPEHNDEVSHTGRHGPHTTGRAVDVLCSGKVAFSILRIALEEGITGIGVSQKGDHGSRFLHLDDVEAKTRPWVWSY